MKKYKILIVAFSALLFMGCNKIVDFRGEWQLTQYCYGKDCTMMADHNIVQIWEFSDKNASVDIPGMNYLHWKSGRQYQENIMDNPIFWAVNETLDTLFTSDLNGQNIDTRLVLQIEKDTMILSSMVNRIVANQRFTRL